MMMMGKIHKVNIAWSTLQCTKNYVWWNVITWYVIWGSKILKSQSLTGEQSHDPQCAEHKSRNGLSVDAALRFQCQQWLHNAEFLKCIDWVTSWRLKLSNKSICSSCPVQLQYYTPLRDAKLFFHFYS